MSKEAALSMMTGQPVTQVNPSLVIGEIPPISAEEIALPPPAGLDSDRFARLAAREAKLVKEREALKLEQQSFKTEQQKTYEARTKYDEIIGKANKFEELKEKDVVEALKHIGLSDTQIFNLMANREEPKPPTPEELSAQAALAAQTEIKKFQDEQALKADKEAKERDERAINGFRKAIGESITKEAEKYEYCAHYGQIAEDLVYETILNIMSDDQKEGVTTAPHDAMKEAIELVENFYENEDKAMSKIKKRQPKETAAPEPETKTQPTRTRTVEAKAPTKPIPTLTNKATATVASTVTGKETPAQKRERLENWLRTGSKS